MQWIDDTFLPDEFVDSFPKQIRDLVRKYGVLDFGFERYKYIDDLKDKGINEKTAIFFVKYGDKYLFFDFTIHDKDPHKVIREPTAEQEKQKGISIPVLPKRWWLAYLHRLGIEPDQDTLLAEKKKKRDLSQVTTLAVFDFDDTLFKSTEAGERLGSDSHLSPESLPDKSKESDWILDTVYKAQELSINPNVYCVMMTGRVGDIFRDKIDTLLNDKNLMFAETHYNEFGGDTAEYKIDRIHKIIDKLPNVRRLIMWEDQEEKAEKYTEEFANILQFKIHMVGQKK